MANLSLTTLPHINPATNPDGVPVCAMCRETVPKQSDFFLAATRSGMNRVCIKCLKANMPQEYLGYDPERHGYSYIYISMDKLVEYERNTELLHFMLENKGRAEDAPSIGNEGPSF